MLGHRAIGRRTAGTLLAGAALSLMAAFAGTASAQTKGAPDKITFAWPGAGSSSLAPFAFAQELGYFKDDNLTLDIVYLQGAGIVLPQLMSGGITTSYITLDPLAISRQPGRPNFDARFAYNAVRRSPWEISVLDSSPIKSIKDLAGKTIGVGALTFGNVPMTRAILKRAGVEAEIVPVGVGASAFFALRNGKIDALNLWDVQNAQLEVEGTKIRRLELPPEFSTAAGHSLPFTNKMIRERPDIVGRFGRVIAKGTVACVANPEGCLYAYWKHFPNTKRSGTDAEALAYEMPLMQSRLQNMVFWPDGQPHEFGKFSDNDFETIINSLREGGVIKGPEIKLDTLYTNQFVPEFNRFDRAAVEAQAKAYKPN
jgi:NitT/TauT family transport system substrate-binding protein